MTYALSLREVPQCDTDNNPHRYSNHCFQWTFGKVPSNISLKEGKNKKVAHTNHSKNDNICDYVYFEVKHNINSSIPRIVICIRKHAIC